MKPHFYRFDYGSWVIQSERPLSIADQVSILMRWNKRRYPSGKQFTYQKFQTKVWNKEHYNTTRKNNV